MGSSSKDEQQRVKTLLLDTITLLCKNGLAYNRSLKVQGLLGVTIDDEEVFIVHLNELTENQAAIAQRASNLGKRQSTSEDSPATVTPRKRRRRSSSREQSLSSPPSDVAEPTRDFKIKTEPNADDVILLDSTHPKEEHGGHGDEGLDFALGSIDSMVAPNLDLSVTQHDPNSQGHGTYVTGLVPNMSNLPQYPGDPDQQMMAGTSMDHSHNTGVPPPWHSSPSTSHHQRTKAVTPGSSQTMHSGTRRSYTVTEKLEAVKVIREKSLNFAEASRLLGVNEKRLREWTKTEAELLNISDKNRRRGFGGGRRPGKIKDTV